MFKISDSDYKKFADNFPIVCVDLIIEYGNKFLLVKRQIKPLKSKYYMPGGGILHGETIRQAALRKARQEVGLDCTFKGIVGILEGMFGENEVDAESHSIGFICYMVANTKKVVLDFQHSEFRWASIAQFKMVLKSSQTLLKFYKEHSHLKEMSNEP